MKRFHDRVKTLLVTLTVIGMTNLNSQGFSSQTTQQLQQVLETFQNNPSFVGGISAAIKVDGLASWSGATGYAARNVDAQNNLLPGGTSFTVNNLSRAYSITKTFTAALVLELAKEGAFSLDDPIGDYMPLMNAYNPALNSSVTIRQLLNHESGYSDWEENIQLQIALAFDPYHEWTSYELMAFTEQLSAPGTVRRYSHNNFVFLGAIIETATGRDVEDLYRERFFTPLGLTSIYLEGREAHGSRPALAAPHDNISIFNPIFQLTGQPTFPNAHTNISALPFNGITSLGFTGGGLNSNAAELAEWSNAFFGNRVTSPGVLDSILNSISNVPDEFGNRLGYGVKITAQISGEFDFIGHNGSAPGYRSVMFYNADRKMTIVVLTNFAGASAYDIAKALYEALPEFICGSDNKKEKKIRLCKNGETICVDRAAAAQMVKRGATLGPCSVNNPTGSRPIAAKEMPFQQPTLQVFPNPAAGSVNVLFGTAEKGVVNLSLFDAGGRLVKVLFNRSVANNNYEKIPVDTDQLKAGVYFIRMQAGSSILNEKLVVRH